MTMFNDPHENNVRKPDYSKDAAQEEFFDLLNQALASIDIPIQSTGIDPVSLPIIYVVGAPRSGTTLLSQLLSRYLPVGYINNLIARFWLNPSLGIRISNAVLSDAARERISLTSTHGSTRGAENPHEFGYFWRNWLDLDRAPTHHLSEVHLNTLDAQGLKHALENEIIASFNAPIVFKNVICGFHASFLTRLHPVSLFVYIDRDPYHVSASILNVRKERYGSYGSWWSLKPSTYPYNLGDPVTEVANQVKDCRKEMESELSRIGVHSIRISYEELCRDPRQVLETICAKVRVFGYDLHPIATDYPALKVASAPSLPSDLASRLSKENFD